MNSNFPPSRATDPRGDVVQETHPEPNPDLATYAESHPNASKREVSPRAREAAHIEIVNSESGQLPGCAVQNALDAVVAEKTAILDRNWRAMYDQEVARLTKELAAERERVGRFQKELIGSSEQLSTERVAREKALAELVQARDSYTVGLDAIRAQLASVTSERDGLKSAITKHHDQKADDRCWMDDAELYRAAGFETMDAHVGDQDAMLRNCQRFIACRTMGGMWKSYAELEAERDTLAQRVAELEKDANEFGEWKHKLDEYKAQWERHYQGVEKELRDEQQAWFASHLNAESDDLRAERDELNARCEKLEKALCDLVSARGIKAQFDARQVALKALNQSPE